MKDKKLINTEMDKNLLSLSYPWKCPPKSQGILHFLVDMSRT